MKVKEDDTEEEEREKRQIDFNMDKLEMDQKPEELKAVFQGATTEKIKGNFSNLICGLAITNCFLCFAQR